MGYQFTSIGNIRLPYLPLLSTGAGITAPCITIQYNDQMFELPEPLNAHMQKTVQEKSNKAKKEKKVFFDGEQIRLTHVTPYGDLFFEKSSFFRFACSNRALGEKIDGKTIYEHCVKNVYDLNDGLGNSTGVNIVLVTSDDKIVLLKRSTKIHQYPGLYGIPAGFMDPEDIYGHKKYMAFHYLDKKVVSPFITAMRELEEEVGITDIDYWFNGLQLLEVGRAGDDLHPEIILSLKTDIKGKEIQKRSKFSRDKFEFDGKPIIVPFNPRDLAPYLNKMASERPDGTPNLDNAWVPKKSPQWAPAHWRGVYLALVNKFGRDEVWKELNC